jgi:hypothetical protein
MKDIGVYFEDVERNISLMLWLPSRDLRFDRNPVGRDVAWQLSRRATAALVLLFYFG